MVEILAHRGSWQSPEEANSNVAFHRRLIEGRETCPLFDRQRYVRHLESGYEKMWERFVSGKEPEHIIVPENSGSHDTVPGRSLN